MVATLVGLIAAAEAGRHEDYTARFAKGEKATPVAATFFGGSGAEEFVDAGQLPAASPPEKLWTDNNGNLYFEVRGMRRISADGKKAELVNSRQSQGVRLRRRRQRALLGLQRARRDDRAHGRHHRAGLVGRRQLRVHPPTDRLARGRRQERARHEILGG